MTGATTQEFAQQTTHYPDRYIQAIDGLRAIAVLSVILFHLDASLLPGGFIGVDVFFVISGYVISRSLANSKAPSFRVFILDFYKRRILRIFPALIVCLVLTSLFAKLFIPQGFWLGAHNNWTGLWAFFGISNIYLANNVDGYFSSRTPFNPYVHTWSLAVEEQFYVIFPLIFYLWLRLREKSSHQHRMAFVVLPIMASLSLSWAAYETQISHERAFYLLPSRFWELAAGAMLYQFHSYRPDYFNRISQWLIPLGVLILGIGFGLADEAHFPFPWATVPVLGAILLLAGVSTSNAENSIVGIFLASPVMAYFGRISFSLYLWHWPVFVLFRWTLGLSLSTYWVLALSLTFTLAVSSYHFIELTVRRSRCLSVLHPWKILIGGVIATYGAFFFVTQLFYAINLRGISLSVTKDQCIWSPSNINCQQETKANSTSRSLFVIGDSHADAYSLMANMAANRLGAEAYIHSIAGCPIAKFIESDTNNPICLGSESKTLIWLDQRAKPGDIVFLASLRLHRLGNQWGAFDLDKILIEANSKKQAENNKRALVEAERLIKQLNARGLYVLIDAPKPIFKSPPFRCSDWFNNTNPVCSAGFVIERDFLLKFRQSTMASLHYLHNELGVFIWDPFPLLCPKTTCFAFDENKPKFFDGDHLSGYGNRILVESFTEQLSAIWK